MAEAFILEQIELKLQMVDGEVDRAKVNSLIKRWTRQMSTDVNRAASKKNMCRASKMINAANSAQQQASSATHSDEDFSSSAAQVLKC